MVVHCALRIKDRKTGVHKESPGAQWYIEPEEPPQVDDEAHTFDAGLVGIPLTALTLQEAESSEDEFVEPKPQVDMDD